MAWSEVCKPKSEGGLGIKCLKEVNTVCCMKLIWRIVSNAPSLWVNWIKQTLLRQESLWAVKDSMTTGSWMWRKLLKYRGIAKPFHNVKILNGNSTFFGLITGHGWVYFGTWWNKEVRSIWEFPLKPWLERL